MAKPIIDNTTTVSAANVLKFWYGDGAGDHQMLAYRIYYTGAAWSVSALYGCANTSATISVVWDGTNDELDVDLSGLTYDFGPTYPVILVSPTKPSGSPATANFWPQASASSATAFEIKWFNSAGTHQTTESTQMDAQVWIGGIYT